MTQATDRLLSQLNATQLQQKDNPTYQVIKQLINRIKDLENSLTSGSTTTIVNETIQQYFINEGDGGDGGGDIGPPGIKGDTGAIGPTGAEGPPFPAFYMMESDSPEEIMPIPGSQGIQGVTGNTGADGASFPFMLPEPDMGEDQLFAFPQPVASGGVWELIATRACSATADEDFTNLSAYSEIFVICNAITKATTGLTSVRVSTDNGATFLSASGDYASVAGTGVITNNTLISTHITNATAARTTFCRIVNFNGSASPKYAFAQVAGTLPEWVLPSAAALNPLNAIRVFGSAGGNLTGGTIYVFGRK